MNILLVNASPKFKDSSSGVILNDLKTFFSDDTVKIIDIHTNKLHDFSDFDNQDAVVFAFPLYVDTVPAHILEVLCRLEQYLKGRKIKVGAIVNCGFYEGVQNQNAIDIVKIWCHKTGLEWIRGIGIGGGGMLAQVANIPVNAGPKKPIGVALQTLAEDIKAGGEKENLFVSVGLPRFLYIKAAHMGWKNGIKSNGLKVKDIRRRM